jgi:hypothetical protein
MNDSELRKDLIRLAYRNPELRPKLLPLLVRQAGGDPVLSFRVTIDEMETDPGLRSDGVRSRSIEGYASNLEAHAKELSRLAPSQAREIGRIGKNLKNEGQYNPVIPTRRFFSDYVKPLRSILQMVEMY